MKKVLSLALSMLVAFALVGCSSQSNGKKELLIGVSPDYPPYESLNTKNETEGFDIDMTKELIKIMNKNGGNYTYKWKQMSFDTLRGAVQSNQIDLAISGFTKHKEWDVLWSNKYNNSKQVALVKAGSSIKKNSDLNGKKIGAQLAATGETVANDIKKKAPSTTVKTSKDAKVLVEMIKSNGLDAVILDEAVAKNYVKNNKTLEMVNDEALLVEENLIIANKNSKDLIKEVNKAVDEFVKSKKYTELKSKWGC